MRALRSLGDRLVTTIVDVFLAALTEFVCFVCLDTTFMLAFLALGLCFYATALTGKHRAGSQKKCYRVVEHRS